MMQLNVRPAGSAGKEHPVPGLARRAVTALLVLCSLWVVAVPASATGPHFFRMCGRRNGFARMSAMPPEGELFAVTTTECSGPMIP